MGYEANVYCGVYIKVPKQTVDVHVASKVACAKDHKHKVQTDYKFCPICGGAINIEYKTEKQDVFFRPGDEEFDCDNDFYMPEYHSVWLVNSIDDGCIVDVDDDTGAVAITPDFINGAIEDFHSRHRPLLEKLKKATKGGAVVEFGVLKYWS